MKLFIDTSNKKLIFAIVVGGNKVTSFYCKDTNNDIAKNAIPELEKFLSYESKTINDVDEFMFTIGPGSYTGVKVALNIITTLSLTNEFKQFYIIDSFKLVEQNKYDHTVIPFGKSKYYHKRNKKDKIFVITEEEKQNLKNVNDGYANFTKEVLEQKINSKAFKIVDNLDKVKIKYLSAF